MKTFNQFLTEARVTTKRGRILRTLTRQVKKVGKIALNSKPAKKSKTIRRGNCCRGCPKTTHRNIMEDYLIDYLIDEGYANTEGSAYKILEVISEGFYEYLLNEALTPEQRAAGRARVVAARRARGIPEPSAERTAEIMGRIRSRKPTARGGYRQSTETPRGTMRTPEGAHLPDTRDTKGPTIVVTRDRETTRRLNIDRENEGGQENETKRPTKMPTHRDVFGNEKPNNSVDRGADSTRTMGGRQGRGLGAGQTPMQTTQNRNSVNVGAFSREPGTGSGQSQRYSDTPSNGNSSSSKKKGPQQTSQPPESASGNPVRRRVLPSEATRSTSQRPTTPRKNPSQTGTGMKPNPKTGQRANPNRARNIVDIQPKKP
jgi:hypothetical protein